MDEKVKTSEAAKQRDQNRKKEYECRVCLQIFNNVLSRNVHENENHPLPVDCKCCTKKINSYSYYWKHVRVHLGQTIAQANFMCEKCGKYFSTSKTLAKHDKTHVRDMENVQKCPNVFKVTRKNNENLSGKTGEVEVPRMDPESKLKGAGSSLTDKVSLQNSSIRLGNVNNFVELKTKKAKNKSIVTQVTEERTVPSIYENTLSSIGSSKAENVSKAQKTDVLGHLIEEAGIKIGDNVVEDEALIVHPEDLGENENNNAQQEDNGVLMVLMHDENNGTFIDEVRNHELEESGVKNGTPLVDGTMVDFVVEESGLETNSCAEDVLKTDKQDTITEENSEHLKAQSKKATLYKKSRKTRSFYTCRVCSKPFPDLSMRRKHENGQHPLPIECNLCPKEINSFLYFRKHKKSHLTQIFLRKNGKADSQQPLKKPRKRTKNVDENKKLVKKTQNVNEKSKQKICECRVCFEKFDQFIQRNNHEYTQHALPIKCPICVKEVNSFSYYERHRKVHLGLTNYKCRFCEKALASRGLLEDHERTHTGERPFPCEKCGKSFSSDGNLKSHMKYHSRKKYFFCKVCGYGAVTKGNMNIHLKRHYNERTHVCHLCAKAFVGSSDLKKHIRRHENGRL